MTWLPRRSDRTDANKAYGLPISRVFNPHATYGHEKNLSITDCQLCTAVFRYVFNNCVHDRLPRNSLFVQVSERVVDLICVFIPVYLRRVLDNGLALLLDALDRVTSLLHTLPDAVPNRTAGFCASRQTNMMPRTSKPPYWPAGKWQLLQAMPVPLVNSREVVDAGVVAHAARRVARYIETAGF